MRFFLVFIAFLSIANLLNGQSKKDSLNFDEDLELCYFTLLKYHPKIKTAADSLALKADYLKISKKINNSTKQSDFKWIVGQLMQSVNDGHTGLNTSLEKEENDYASIPIFMKYINGHFYISDAYTDTTLIGTEILSINNVAIENWFERSSGFSPQTDNYEPTNYTKQYRKCLAMSLFCDEVQTNQTTTTITYLDSGAVKSKDIKILREIDRIAAKKEREKIGIKQYDFKIFNDTIAYIKLRSFMAPIFNKGKIRSDFEKINEKGIHNVILDLRSNSGGSLAFCSWMVSHFIDTTHTMASSLSMRGNALSLMNGGVLPKLIKKTKRKQRKQNVIEFELSNELYKETLYNTTTKKSNGFQKSKVIVLIDEGTYSAASITAIALQQSGKVLMGRPTSSNTSLLNAHLFELFELPNSKIVLRIPMLNGKMFDKNLEPKQLVPDVIVPYELGNLKINKDEVLEKAKLFFKEMK